MFVDVVVLGVGDPWKCILTYTALEGIAPGHVVFVPWGKKQALAVVLELHSRTPHFETKAVIERLYPLPLPPYLLSLAQWMSTYYFEPLQRCIETIVLCKKVVKPRKTAKQYSEKRSEQPVLNEHQQEAVDAILKSDDDLNTFLLHGVTGSGKTEVYLAVIAEVLAQGKQVIYLVPEIGLTPQTVNRVKARFGEGVHVVNSELSDGERYRLMEDLHAGRVNIVIGSRSALFTPFQNLGLIIIDECHDGSYKQDASPHYAAVTAARYIAELLRIPLVLGSATPTIGQFYQSQSVDRRSQNILDQSLENSPIFDLSSQILSLPARANDALLPRVTIADMREELKKRNFTTVSDELEQQLRESLAHGEQAVLFMNRRGFSSAFVCRACGWRASCPNCSVALVYHKMYGERSFVLVCHQCDHHEQLPAACKECGSLLVKPLGSGTERVVDDVQKLFPTARIIRMDKDTTARKGSHDEIYQSFVDGSFDILVGTQMVTKGWDVSGVTCVGIMNADSLLHMPMYDAAERAFTLMMQVAGRAGRTKERPGSVVIQTYTPDHYAVTSAALHDYLIFYEQELAYRQMLRYPPFSTLVELTYSHEKMENARRKAQELHDELAKKATEMRESGTMDGKIELLGPSEAPIHRIKEIYYYQIVMKGEKKDLDRLLDIVPRDWSINVDI